MNKIKIFLQKIYYKIRHPLTPIQDTLCSKGIHVWTACINKHGVMHRRVCSNCSAYQNLIKGKWKGYKELKYHSKRKVK